MLVAAVAMLIPALGASAAPRGSYSPTLAVDLGAARAATTDTSTNYLVTGCGYNPAYGGVTVVVHSPQAISFGGQMPDANGCINVWNFWTQGSGHYDVDAYQTMRKKSTLVASTFFDL